MNNNNNNNSTSETLILARQIITQKLDALKDGERITLRDLIDLIVFETHMPVSLANGIIPSLVKEYPGVEVSAGRSGGVFKGGKPIRIDPRPRCPQCTQVVPLRLLHLIDEKDKT